MNGYCQRRIVSAVITWIIGVSLSTLSPLAAGSQNPVSRSLRIPETSADWIIDGKLSDVLWLEAEQLEFTPSLEGVPEDLGGTVRVLMRRSQLCLGSFLPEPGGKVQARSIGYNPTWEKYALTSPAVEDRIRFQIRETSSSKVSSLLEITLNAWGAIRVERDGLPVSQSEIQGAATISPEGWSVEIGVPLRELGLSGIPRDIHFSVVRIRCARPLAPEFRWQTSEYVFPIGDYADNARAGETKAAVYAPPQVGNAGPPLEVGRVQKVPPLDISWSGSLWDDIPGFELPRNESHPRPARYPTEVKWVHDGRILQVFFRNVEDGRLDVNADTRDANVGSDDHVVVHLALTGSASVQILANPVGAIFDALSRGPRAYTSSTGSIDAKIDGRFIKEKDCWMVKLNLPLEEIANALGESGVPKKWKVLIGRVRRERPGEPAETSTLPVIGSPFLNAPARYRSLILSDRSPLEIPSPEPAFRAGAINTARAELANLDPDALSRVQRKYYDVTHMVQRQIDKQTKTLAMEEHSEWDQVKTLQDWETFRDKRISILHEALGEFPRKRCNLDYRITSTYHGEGYQIQNIVYRSRPGFYIAANLYLPENPPEKMPGMIVLPAHHYPKKHGEMKDTGMIWARTGVAVLVMEHIGYGERLETSPLYRQAYESEYLLSLQLELVGQSLQGWIVYDIMRTVDLFEELGYIDPERILLLGSVTWGGGRRAAPAGLFDERIDAEIIYNFGRVYWYGWGIRNMINHKITPWFIVNAFAPRKLVYAHEFWYEGEEGPGYPSVWVPAWPRYQRIYRLYGAEQNLAVAQGEGLLRAGATEFVPAGDCYMLGTLQRRSLYPILETWFDIPLPLEADRNLPKDSGLGDVRHSADYPLIKYQESLRRPPDSAILSIPPSVSTRLDRKALHQIAAEMGRELLTDARRKRQTSSPEERRRALGMQLTRILGDIEPEPEPRVTDLWKKALSSAELEAIIIETEPGILVPLFLLTPRASTGDDLPVVLALAEGGKSRFLQQRTSEILRLLEQGFAVCIPDCRGTGETEPDQYNRSDEPALSSIEMGGTLLGSRLKDARTVLEYLKHRPGIDDKRISLWGESFAPVNRDSIWVDELQGKPVSPQIQHLSSPLGAHLALLLAFYHPEVHAVAARGALISYLSLLEDNFIYAPFDILVPRLLEVADISDIASSVNPTPLLLVAPVTGRNFPASNSDINRFRQVVDAYGSPADLTIEPGTSEPEQVGAHIVDWLVERK